MIKNKKRCTPARGERSTHPVVECGAHTQPFIGAGAEEGSRVDNKQGMKMKVYKRKAVTENNKGLQGTVEAEEDTNGPHEQGKTGCSQNGTNHNVASETRTKTSAHGPWLGNKEQDV